MEIWKDIKGYEGRYQVSNLGNVKSLCMWSSVQGRYIQREKKLKQYKNNAGYMQIGLKKDGTRKLGLVHRLVAEAFIPNESNKREVNHINGIKTDNVVSNLEWATSSENTIHSYKNGLQKHYARMVVQCDSQGNAIKEWNSIRYAATQTGVCEENIGACCRNNRRTAGGYIWRYAERK